MGLIKKEPARTNQERAYWQSSLGRQHSGKGRAGMPRSPSAGRHDTTGPHMPGREPGLYSNNNGKPEPLGCAQRP